MGLSLHYTDGQTPLSDEETEGLKLDSVTTQGELDEFEQLNIERAVAWTIHATLKPGRVLTEKFVKDLHKRMYGEVWKWAGEFRKTEKNIGIPWIQIPMALKVLLDDTKYRIENNIFSPEEIVIRFKHSLVSIHCFPNGNGRHSRLMADVLLKSTGGKEAFSWHQSNMVKADDVRKEYIRALKKADSGNLQPLIDFATN